jgi:hypothetical protein
MSHAASSIDAGAQTSRSSNHDNIETRRKLYALRKEKYLGKDSKISQMTREEAANIQK